MLPKLHLLPWFRAACAIVTLSQLNACSGETQIGKWQCGSAAGSDSGARDGGAPLQSPWSTGFEAGFCEYQEGGGFCYTTGAATQELVESPVHSGRYAAAFTVLADGTNASTQSRCVREGLLPEQAYYSAWYLVPSVPANPGVWILLYFQGGASTDALTALWQLSLVENGSGGLRLDIYDSGRNANFPNLQSAPPIPIGSWFHLEMYWKRPANAAGEVAIFQDGQNILRATDLSPDTSPFGQWYIGNLATQLDPVKSTVYVDDVTIGSTP